MSTRANIIVKDSFEEVVLFKHYDGYEKDTIPQIKRAITEILSEANPNFNADNVAAAIILADHCKHNTKPISHQTYQQYEKYGFANDCASGCKFIVDVSTPTKRKIYVE